MNALPVQRSLPEPTALACWLADEYPLDAVPSCTLIRSSWNDTYRVATASRRLVCRVYGPGRHDETAIRYELELVAHLTTRGVRACAALATRRGEPFAELALPEGIRPAALFAHAEGRPEVPSSLAKARRLAAALAQLHRAADSFRPVAARPKKDLASGIRATLAHLDELLPERGDDAAFARGLADRVLARLGAVDARELDLGPIHGDPFSHNAAIAGNGDVAWFDFDECGPGLRAEELTVPYWLSRASRAPELWESFVAAYRSERSLADRDLELVPALFVGQLLATLWELARRRAQSAGSEAVRALVAARLTQLRTAADWLAG
jgi:Ser/Thr protein kinase RdoA (MazF antagonist)